MSLLGVLMPGDRQKRRIRVGVRAATRSFALLLILGGVGIFGYVAYQLWFTSGATAAAQDRLTAEFHLRLTGGPLEPIVTESGAATEPAPTFEDPDDVPVMLAVAPSENTQFELEGIFHEVAPELGRAVGRITIPDIELDWIVVEGVGPVELKLGPGHMPGTPLPGQPGNAVVSGHRTTNGAPFHDIDLLEPGDLIHVQTLIGIHTYEFVAQVIVAPDETWVTRPRDGAWLTLTSCHPKLSARQRIVVIAELVEGPNWPIALAARKG